MKLEASSMLADLAFDQEFTEKQLQDHFGVLWSPEILNSDEIGFNLQNGERSYFRKTSGSDKRRTGVRAVPAGGKTELGDSLTSQSASAPEEDSVPRQQDTAHQQAAQVAEKPFQPEQKGAEMEEPEAAQPKEDSSPIVVEEPEVEQNEEEEPDVITTKQDTKTQQDESKEKSSESKKITQIPVQDTEVSYPSYAEDEDAKGNISRQEQSPQEEPSTSIKNGEKLVSSSHEDDNISSSRQAVVHMSEAVISRDKLPLIENFEQEQSSSDRKEVTDTKGEDALDRPISPNAYETVSDVTDPEIRDWLDQPLSKDMDEKTTSSNLLKSETNPLVDETAIVKAGALKPSADDRNCEIGDHSEHSLPKDAGEASKTSIPVPPLDKTSEMNPTVKKKARTWAQVAATKVVHRDNTEKNSQFQPISQDKVSQDAQENPSAQSSTPDITTEMKQDAINATKPEPAIPTPIVVNSGQGVIEGTSASAGVTHGKVESTQTSKSITEPEVPAVSRPSPTVCEPKAGDSEVVSQPMQDSPPEDDQPIKFCKHFHAEESSPTSGRHESPPPFKEPINEDVLVDSSKVVDEDVVHLAYVDFEEPVSSGSESREGKTMKAFSETKNATPDKDDGQDGTLVDSEVDPDASPVAIEDEKVKVSKSADFTKEYQQPVQEQPLQKDQEAIPKTLQYEQVREPTEVKRLDDSEKAPEQGQAKRDSIDLNEDSGVVRKTQIQTQPEVTSTEPAKFKEGDRVVGSLGHFGTVAVSFGGKAYGVDFDDGSKYRVTEDQLHSLPEHLQFPIGSVITYEGKNNIDMEGRVEKYFGEDVYGIKFKDGRKYRVKAHHLQSVVQQDVEILKELEISKFTDISTWNYHNVLAWLDRIGLKKYRKNFQEDRITGRKLLTLTNHNLSDIGVKRKDRPVLLEQLEKLRDLCVSSTIPGSQGLILDFDKRPFDFEIEWYDHTLTVTEISSKLEEEGVCRGMKIISCNGTTFRKQTFEDMLETIKTAMLPATIKFEKILVKEDKKKPIPKADKLPRRFGQDPIYVIKQGWLNYANREVKGKEPSWKRRWCVLQSDDTLHLYTKRTAKKSRRFLPLTLKNMSTRGDPGPGKDYFVFVVPCKERTYKFKCQCLTNLNSWITAINEMFTAQKKRARKAPLPQGPSRIIETLIKKNELSALWKHPQNGRTALQLCLEMNKMDIILRYINNDLSLLRLTKEEGGLDLNVLVGQALESVMSIGKKKTEDVKQYEDTLTLIGTIYDRTPLSSWHELLPPPCTVIDNLVELLHTGTKRTQDHEPTLHRKIVLSCEAVIATLCQPGALRSRDNLHHAILRCFENRAISHLFEILLKTECDLYLPGTSSLLYRAIDINPHDVTPIRYNQMFEILVRKGAPVSQLSYGDQADMQNEGIDALTKSISLLHIESIQIMLRLGTEIQPVHTRALFTLVTRPDVVIIDKQKFLETLETLLTYGAVLGRPHWMNMGSFIKANGEDLKRVGERAALSSKERIGRIHVCLEKYLGTDENILKVVSGFIPQFNSTHFFDGLERYLEIRRKCLEQRFPEKKYIEEVLRKDDKCVVQ